MFDQSVDDRLSAWASLRSKLDISENPLEDLWEAWKSAPFIPYNNKIDPYFQYEWPTPWEILVENKYDDFTKALMIGWTLKLTKKFQNNLIELQTFIDRNRNYRYNVICVNKQWIINYHEDGPVNIKDLPDSFCLENLIELQIPG